ncbi:MAG: hypothetical protein WC728_06635 [Elusimicrobiota bacterium]
MKTRTIPLVLFFSISTGLSGVRAAPPTDVISEEQALRTELEVQDDLKSGGYGKAVSLLKKYAQAKDVRAMDMAARIILANKDLQKAGWGKLDAEGVKALLSSPDKGALLLAASQYPNIQASLLKKVEEAVKAGKVKDLGEYLEKELTPEAVHKVLTEMSQDPKAPKKDGEQEGKETAVPAEGKPTTSGKGAQDRFEYLRRTYWNADEIYGKRGDRNFIDIGGRQITFNIVSIKDETGALKTRLTVFDRTDTANIHGKSFDLDDPALQKAFTFKMDERPDATNTNSYTIQLVPDGKDIKIQFTSADGQKAEVPTVGELARMRAQKVLDYGYVVKVGEKEFYLGGEGYGSVGQNTFWDKATLQKVLDPSADWRELVPQMASVTVKRENGKDVPVGQSSIGQVDGQWYDLKWNPEKGYVEVVKGAPPGTGTPGGTEEWPAFDLPNLNLRINSTNADVAAINAKFAAAGLEVRLYSVDPPRAPHENFFLMHKSRQHVPISFAGGKITAADLKGIELLGGSLLAARDSTGTTYYDLKGQPEGWGDVWKVTKDSIDIGKGRSTWNGDVRSEALGLALRDAAQQAGLKADVEQVLSRAQKLVSEGKKLEKFFWTGDEKVFAKFSGLKPLEVWPQVGTPVPVDNADGQAGQVRFDPAPVTVMGFDGFKEKVGDLARVSEGKTSALYAVEKDGVKQTYVIFRVGETQRSSPILAFEDVTDPARAKGSRARDPMPKGVQAGGVRETANPLQYYPPEKFDGRDVRQAGFILIRDGPQAGHGKFKGNIAGVAFWWGEGVTLDGVLKKFDYTDAEIAAYKAAIKKIEDAK